MERSRRPLLEFVSWEVGVDLRTCQWSRRYVDHIVKKYRLQDGQAVAFFNNSKFFGGSGSHPPKCRLYFKWNGQAVSLIPPVDEDNKQVSYQIKLNEWIRLTFSVPKAMEQDLNQVTVEQQRRMDAAKKIKNKRAA